MKNNCGCKNNSGCKNKCKNKKSSCKCNCNNNTNNNQLMNNLAYRNLRLGCGCNGFGGYNNLYGAGLGNGLWPFLFLF